ncbi:NAD-dependent epimerase/dehydratase family protein [Chloroflexi bacterium TSY]|nr:NAD-dependent epimerase/dehydratase family protein [Chloroflexi bacterium TSY]
MSTNRNVPQTIAVTGALGNLGTKLLHHLARCEFSQRLIALDLQTPTTDQAASLHAAAKERTLPPAIDFVQCDLSNWHDRRWRDALEQSDAVVHFAAQNPYPEATWADAAASIDMTLHIANAAADSAQLRRMVFATSNHVMGRYKDSPLADTIGPHELHVDLPQGSGQFGTPVKQQWIRHLMRHPRWRASGFADPWAPARRAKRALPAFALAGVSQGKICRRPCQLQEHRPNKREMSQQTWTPKHMHEPIAGLKRCGSRTEIFFNSSSAPSRLIVMSGPMVLFSSTECRIIPT